MSSSRVNSFHSNTIATRNATYKICSHRSCKINFVLPINSFWQPDIAFKSKLSTFAYCFYFSRKKHIYIFCFPHSASKKIPHINHTPSYGVLTALNIIMWPAFTRKEQSFFQTLVMWKYGFNITWVMIFFLLVFMKNCWFQWNCSRVRQVFYCSCWLRTCRSRR